MLHLVCHKQQTKKLKLFGPRLLKPSWRMYSPSKSCFINSVSDVAWLNTAACTCRLFTPHTLFNVAHAAQQAEFNTKILERERAMVMAMGIQVCVCICLL